MATGTPAMRAIDLASSVFPEPVGPTSTTLLFWISTSSSLPDDLHCGIRKSPQVRPGGSVRFVYGQRMSRISVIRRRVHGR